MTYPDDVEDALERLERGHRARTDAGADLTEVEKAAIRALLTLRRETPISGAEDWPPTREAIETAADHLDDEHVTALEGLYL